MKTASQKHIAISYQHQPLPPQIDLPTSEDGEFIYENDVCNNGNFISCPRIKTTSERRGRGRGEKSKNDRKWITVNKMKEVFAGESSGYREDPSMDHEKVKDVEIYIKTRSSTMKNYIDDKLYSCIKYEIIQKFNGDIDVSKLIGDNKRGILGMDPKFSANGKNPIILCKIQVVDPTTLQEIQKNHKSILSGVVEATISLKTHGHSNDQNERVARMKIKFQDVSYHHDKKEFAFLISYFLNTDLKNPILVKRSPGFLVYARKPNQTFEGEEDGIDYDEEEEEEKEKEMPSTKNNDKKRKRGLSSKQTLTSKPLVDCNGDLVFPKKPTKKMKLMDEFTLRLDDLVENKLKHLSAEEKKKAIDLIWKRLVLTSFDPDMRSSSQSAEKERALLGYDKIAHLLGAASGYNNNNNGGGVEETSAMQHNSLI